MNIAVFIAAGLAFIVGYAIGESLAIRDLRAEADGVAFLDGDKERFVLTTTHSKAKKKKILMFAVHGTTDD